MLNLASSGGNQILIKGSRVEWELRRHVNGAVGLNAWCLASLWRLDGDGDRMYSGASIVNPWSVWEVAIRDPSDAAKYSGGLHGYETTQSVFCFADMMPVDLSVTNDIDCNEVVLYHESHHVYPTATGTMAAKVYRRQRWTSDSDTCAMDVRIVWQDDHPTAEDFSDQVYVGMVPVLRSIGAQQITSSAEYITGGPTQDVSDAGFTAVYQSGRDGIDIGCSAEGIALGVRHDVDGTTIQWHHVSPSAAYNKLYCSLVTTGIAADGEWTIGVEYQTAMAAAE